MDFCENSYILYTRNIGNFFNPEVIRMGKARIVKHTFNYNKTSKRYQIEITIASLGFKFENYSYYLENECIIIL